MPGKIDTSSPTIGEMLGNAVIYRVPPYQRDYAWTDEEVSQFWADLLRAMARENYDYFLGSMVVSETEGGKVINVIDGQQRLTTVSLLLTAVRDLLREQHHEKDATRVDEGFLGTYDWETKLESPRIELNKTNRVFYSEVIRSGNRATIEENTRRSATHLSNRRLGRTYLFFRRKIGELITDHNAIDKVSATIVQAIKFRLSLIRIAVKSDYDAYLLFETLNDRGLELSVADLLKNYLFQQASSSKAVLDEVQLAWDEMISSLKDHEPKRFLRHYWLSTKGIIRDKELYNEITNSFKGPTPVRDFAAKLRDAAHFYGSFDEAESTWWDDFEAPDRRLIRKAIEELNLFRFTQCYPLLLAIMETEPSLFPRVLRMIVNFSFRYIVIGNRSSNDLEKPFSDAAISVRGKTATNIPDIFSFLAPLYPADADFKSYFAKKAIKESRLARYVLAGVSDHQSRSKGMKVIDNPDDVNVEHILPQKFKEQHGWLATFANEEEAAECVNRIGNLTLLLSALNRKLQNDLFAKKVVEYGKNPLEITKDVLGVTNWDAAAIDKRQVEMAEVAAQVWRIDP